MVMGDLGWPLQAMPSFSGFGYHSISNFVDHDPRAPGFVQDDIFGTRSDSANGSNHAATDWFLTPLSACQRGAIVKSSTQTSSHAPAPVSLRDSELTHLPPFGKSASTR